MKIEDFNDWDSYVCFEFFGKMQKLIDFKKGCVPVIDPKRTYFLMPKDPYRCPDELRKKSKFILNGNITDVESIIDASEQSLKYWKTQVIVTFHKGQIPVKDTFSEDSVPDSNCFPTYIFWENPTNINISDYIQKKFDIILYDDQVDTNPHQHLTGKYHVVFPSGKTYYFNLFWDGKTQITEEPYEWPSVIYGGWGLSVNPVNIECQFMRAIKHDGPESEVPNFKIKKEDRIHVFRNPNIDSVNYNHGIFDFFRKEKYGKTIGETILENRIDVSEVLLSGKFKPLSEVYNTQDVETMMVWCIIDYRLIMLPKLAIKIYNLYQYNKEKNKIELIEEVYEYLKKNWWHWLRFGEFPRKLEVVGIETGKTICYQPIK